MDINIIENQPMVIKTSKARRWSASARIKSFYFAASGIKQFFLTEVHAKIHLVATVLVFVTGVYYKVNTYEAIALTIVMALVWISEMFNTAIEKSVDLVTKDIHPQVKLVKDVAAGAVLLAAITAVIVGGIVFIPKIFML